MSQLKGLLADLREEVPRIKAGAGKIPILLHDNSAVRSRSVDGPWVGPLAGCPSIQSWRDGSGGQRLEGAGERAGGDRNSSEARGAPVAAVHSITWPGLAAGVAPLSGGGGGATSEEDEPADSRRADRGWPGQGWWLRLSGVDRS